MQNENPRTDAVSRKRWPKEKLFRLVKRPEGYVYDPSGVLPGRGLYVARSLEALEALKKKGAKILKGAPLAPGSLEQMEAEL